MVLPALCELWSNWQHSCGNNSIYTNLYALGFDSGLSSGYYFWASQEYTSTTSLLFSFQNNADGNGDKNSGFDVICVRAIIY